MPDYSRINEEILLSKTGATYNDWIITRELPTKKIKASEFKKDDKMLYGYVIYNLVENNLFYNEEKKRLFSCKENDLLDKIL